MKVEHTLNMLDQLTFFCIFPFFFTLLLSRHSYFVCKTSIYREFKIKRALTSLYWYNVSDQTSKIPRRQCSWTLYFIYLKSSTSSINKIAGWSTLSADIYRLNSGLMMIPIICILQSLFQLSWKSDSTKFLILILSLNLRNIDQFLQLLSQHFLIR